MTCLYVADEEDAVWMLAAMVLNGQSGEPADFTKPGI